MMIFFFVLPDLVITENAVISFVEFIQGLFKTVHFAEKGTNQRVKEEAAFMLFVDLLNSCEGMLLCVHT